MWLHPLACDPLKPWSSLQVTARRLQESVPKQAVTPEAGADAFWACWSPSKWQEVQGFNGKFQEILRRKSNAGWKMVRVEKKTRWWKCSWQVCNARNPRQYYCSFDADCKSDCKAKPVKPWLRGVHAVRVVNWQTTCLVLYLEVSLSLRVGQEVRRGVLSFLWKHHPRPLEACGWKSATDRAFSICVQPSPEALAFKRFLIFAGLMYRLSS